MFVLSVEDVSKVNGYRQIMQSTSKKLEVRSLVADTLTDQLTMADLDVGQLLPDCTFPAR